MNTTAVGDALEEAVFAYFNEEIAEGRFWARTDCVRLHRRKGYYSRDRQSNIVFDVSIEVYMPGAEDYSLLFLVECKNYSRAVEVGEVEEFFAKVQQVSGGGVKGVVAARSSFQQGALEYARSKHLGLLRYFEPSELKWVLHRSPSGLGAWVPPKEEWPVIERALTQEHFVSPLYDFYGSNGSTYTNSVNALLWSLAQEGEENLVLEAVTNRRARKQRLVSYVPDEEIEERAGEVLRGVGYGGGGVDLGAICERQSREAQLTLVEGAAQSEVEAARGVLGRIRFEPLEVVVFETSDVNPARGRFTLAHELGHHFMRHGRFMRREFVEMLDLTIDEGPTLALEDIRRMEVQANLFASSLLMPRQPFSVDALSLADSLGLNDKGYGLIYVDDQECNLRSFYQISDRLREEYGVSREAVRLRLERLGLLHDARRSARIGAFLS